MKLPRIVCADGRIDAHRQFRGGFMRSALMEGNSLAEDEEMLFVHARRSRPASE